MKWVRFSERAPLISDKNYVVKFSDPKDLPLGILYWFGESSIRRWKNTVSEWLDEFESSPTISDNELMDFANWMSHRGIHAYRFKHWLDNTTAIIAETTDDLITLYRNQLKG